MPEQISLGTSSLHEHNGPRWGAAQYLMAALLSSVLTGALIGVLDAIGPRAPEDNNAPHLAYSAVFAVLVFALWFAYSLLVGALVILVHYLLPLRSNRARLLACFVTAWVVSLLLPVLAFKTWLTLGQVIVFDGIIPLLSACCWTLVFRWIQTRRRTLTH